MPLISARPSFARSVSGSIPASASASAAGRRRPSASLTSPSPISASAQCASGREVAAGAERAVLGDDRGDAGVQQPQDGLGDLRPGPRVPHRERPGPQQHHRPHDLPLDRLSHPGGVRADQRALQLARGAPPGSASSRASRTRSRRRRRARARRPAARRSWRSPPSPGACIVRELDPGVPPRDGDDLCGV